jgi:cell division protein FtsB
MEKQTIWHRLLMIDRRILYLILFVNIIIFLLHSCQGAHGHLSARAQVLRYD